MDRVSDVRRFYALLEQLAAKVGGPRHLRECDGRQGWPTRGLYFFFEAGEARTASGDGPRVVRVGTHALTSGSRTTLWARLSQHRGVARSGGGNHRGSIFRLLVGEAIIRRQGLRVESWGVGQSLSDASARLGRPATELKLLEASVESEVTRYLGAMPFLWVDIDDEPGRASRRGTVERNAIALLSGWNRAALDEASGAWLGRHSGRDRVRASGLWNNQHVEESHDGAFLDVLAEAIARTRRSV